MLKKRAYCKKSEKKKCKRSMKGEGTIAQNKQFGQEMSHLASD